MRVVIRIISFVVSIVAVGAWLQMENVILLFTAAAFFLTFLGTFIQTNKNSAGHVIKQKSGSFSNNNQTVNIGVDKGSSDD